MIQKWYYPSEHLPVADEYIFFRPVGYDGKYVKGWIDPSSNYFYSEATLVGWPAYLVQKWRYDTYVP